MLIHISPSDGVPIYLQIVQQVRRMVASGELRPGEELPSTRGLAETLVVNPNTVARAYRELEATGVVTTSRGLGTFVAQTDETTALAERQSLLRDRIDALVLESHQMGVSIGELRSLFDESYAAFLANRNMESEID